MRIKTLLLFVFLLTGIAFSQNEGSGRISFERITQAFRMPTEQSMGQLLESWGYEIMSSGYYMKGDESFRIIVDYEEKTAYYWENAASKERRDEIKSQAIEAGLKVESAMGTRDVRMRGKGYSVSLNGNGSINIQKLKK